MNLKPARSRSIGHHRGEQFTLEVTFPGTALLRLQNWKRPHNAQGEGKGKDGYRCSAISAYSIQI